MHDSQGLAGKLKYTSWVKTLKILGAFNPMREISRLDFWFNFPRAIDG